MHIVEKTRGVVLYVNVTCYSVNRDIFNEHILKKLDFHIPFHLMHGTDSRNAVTRCRLRKTGRPIRFPTRVYTDTDTRNSENIKLGPTS